MDFRREDGSSVVPTTDGKQSTRSIVDANKILQTAEISSQLNTFDPTTLPPEGMVAVVSPRRCGKSVLVADLIHNYRKKHKVDIVVLISKSNAGFPQIPSLHRFRSLKPLEQLVQTQLRVKKANMKRKKSFIKSNVIVIIDDFIDKANNDVRSSNLLIKLSTMGRHLSHDAHSNMMVFFLSQQLTAIPPVMRRNMDYVITFKISSRIERKLLTEEWLCLKSGRHGLREAYNVFDIVNEQDFQALVINTTCSNKYTYKDYVYKYKASPDLPEEHWSGTKEDWDVPFQVYF